MAYQKPGLFHYRVAQGICGIVSACLFRRRILRNEIKGVKGPFVVIANHQAALDFVNLIGATRRPMSFVISKSFFSTLPVRGWMEKMGVIPKQQFQTAVSDMKKMRAVIDAGQPLVIYPAGLMCEDGLSTPIPEATYRFLQWLGTDVYMADTTGSYFVMPKWAKGIRPGRTYIDIYKLFDKEELTQLDAAEIRRRTEEALLFDAYRDQETLPTPNRKNRNVEGLENVLYVCPHCGREFTTAAEGDTIRCTACGYEQVSDEYGLLHNRKGLGEEIRYVSDWSRMIYDRLRERVLDGTEQGLSSPVTIKMIDPAKNKFIPVGEGTLALDRDGFHINGTVKGEAVDLNIAITTTPTLPFSPGKHLEVQQGSDIYRCVPQNGRLVIKFINLLKVFFELKNAPTTVG